MPSWESLFPSRLVGPLSSSPPRKPISPISTQPPPSNSRHSLVLTRPTLRRSSRDDHPSGKMSWCRRRYCHEPHTRGSRISLQRSRSNLFYKEGRFAPGAAVGVLEAEAVRPNRGHKPAPILDTSLQSAWKVSLHNRSSQDLRAFPHSATCAPFVPLLQ